MKIWILGMVASAWAHATLALDSTLDTSFGNGGQRLLSYQLASNEPDQGLAILHDSLGRRIVIVVRRNPFPLAPGRPFELILFRYLASGTVDTSFGAGSGQVRATTDWTEFRGALVDRQNRIVVAGTVVDGTPASAGLNLLRLTADGQRDGSFNGGFPGNNGIVGYGFGPSTANRMVAVALLPNDDLVTAANLDQGNGDVILQRISGSNGTPVTAWGNGGGLQIVDLQPAANAARDTVVGLSVLPDGRVLVLAQSCSAALGCLPAAAQLTATSGQLDTSFCASTACMNASVAGANRGRRVVRNLQVDGQVVTQMATTVVLRDDAGRIVYGGRATLASGGAPLLFLRLNANGELDSGFGSPATPGFQSLALAGVPLAASALQRDASGRLVVGGEGEYAGLRRIYVARLGDNGQPDPGFGGAGALVEYFATPAAEDRALRALAFDGARILGLGDYHGASNRDAFLFRLGGSADGVFASGFE
ncbi:MAG: hypothetical protein IT479_10285 [Xanthomonadales bacterium]|nr:hypothetical protein [Xanthomonadales bacterium]MCC6593650.1 hypothetical protein [Xanthomonadales bacterium]